MSNDNAAVGKHFEASIIRYLADLRPYRPAQSSWGDIGDIHVDEFALQAKAITTGSKTIRGYLAAAEAQAARARLPFGAAVVRTDPSAPIDEAMVAMSLRTFRALLYSLNQGGRP